MYLYFYLGHKNKNKNKGFLLLFCFGINTNNVMSSLCCRNLLFKANRVFRAQVVYNICIVIAY